MDQERGKKYPNKQLMFIENIISNIGYVFQLDRPHLPQKRLYNSIDGGVLSGKNKKFFLTNQELRGLKSPHRQFFQANQISRRLSLLPHCPHQAPFPQYMPLEKVS